MGSADKCLFSGVIQLIILSWVAKLRESHFALKVPVSLCLPERGAASLKHLWGLHVVDHGNLNPLRVPPQPEPNTNPTAALPHQLCPSSSSAAWVYVNHLFSCFLECSGKQFLEQQALKLEIIQWHFYSSRMQEYLFCSSLTFTVS